MDCLHDDPWILAIFMGVNYLEKRQGIPSFRTFKSGFCPGSCVYSMGVEGCDAQIFPYGQIFSS